MRTLQASYAAIYAGADLSPLLALLPDWAAAHVSREAGALAAAYVIAELTGPPRLALTLAATPRLARALRGTRAGALLGVRPAGGAAGAAGGGAAS